MPVTQGKLALGTWQVDGTCGKLHMSLQCHRLGCSARPSAKRLYVPAVRGPCHSPAPRHGVPHSKCASPCLCRWTRSVLPFTSPPECVAFLGSLMQSVLLVELDGPRPRTVGVQLVGHVAPPGTA